jgi:hypothetical protein
LNHLDRVMTDVQPYRLLASNFQTPGYHLLVFPLGSAYVFIFTGSR